MNNNIDFTQFRSIAQIVMDLKKPVAVKHIEKLKKGSGTIPYISWSNAVLYLDHYAPGWQYEIRDRSEIGGKLIITVRITIPAKEGLFYREAMGQETAELDEKSYGDSSSNAEAQAFKRAAAKFGLMLYVYNASDQEKAMLLNKQQIEVSNPPPKGFEHLSQTGTAQHQPEAVKPAPNANTGQIAANPVTVELSEMQTKIVNGRAKIQEAGFAPFERSDGATDEQYYARLVEQYKSIKAEKQTQAREALAKPPVKEPDPEPAITETDDEFGFNDASETGETATRSECETLELLAQKVKRNTIELAKEASNGRVVLFPDLLGTEARALIVKLSEELKARSKAKAK